MGASCDIEADVATVWSVLVDVERYPEWNPFTKEVRTTFELGTPVDMQVALTGWWTKHQVEYVTGFEPEREVMWGVVMGAPWLVHADRYQRLTDLGDGRTRYETADVFTGLAVPLVFLVTGGMMRRGFEAVAQGLKRRCEELTRPGGAT